MGRMLEFMKHSIKRRITFMMVVSLLLILISAIIVPWSTFLIVKSYDETTRNLSTSQEHITDIASHTNEIILRVRGYFAYLDSYEYEQIFKAKEELDKSLAAIKSTPLSDKEQDLVQRVETFFDNYLTNIVPKGVVYAENEDYESLRKLITLGASNPVNDIILYAEQSEKQIRVQLNNESQKLLRNLFLQGIYFIVYIIVVLIISIVTTRRLAKDIGDPLGRLSHYALNYIKGETIQEEILARKDEIGLLSRSLNNMIYEIQEKEEELLAQNEELQAQQDELQAQQDELQMALGNMEENEVYLNKRNLLMQSLANTLDKKELLNSIIRNVVEITRSDKGILLLMNDSKDYAAHGISQEEALQFVDGFGQSVAVRSLYSKQLYSRKRDATIGEKGYITEAVQAYDIFVPILKGNGDVAACMVLTRVGSVLEKRDEKEIAGLAGQISLSLDKLELFEVTEGQRQMTQDMLNTIQEGVQLMNLEGQSLQVNQKLYDLMELSYEDSELKGVPLQDFLTHLAPKIEDSELLFQFIRNALMDGTEQAQSMNYVLKNQDTRYIQIYWEPIFRNKQKFGILLVHRDITKEHEVDRMKSEFVSTVSHELRTPLASILGFSELLLHRQLKPERQHKYMTTIHQEAKRLTQLVNDFLDLQRMENDMQFYELKPIDILPLIEEVKELQQASTTNHRIIWGATEDTAWVLGDRDKLFQVMVNLVSNAIKYSPAGGDIHISSRQEGDSLWIEVADEGLGIPEQALSSLFAKFYRVDNSDRREIGGTGLGLAIVKEIVNQHHGDVSVKSQLGTGSTFSMILPVYVRPVVETSVSQTVGNAHEAVSLDVMLVENDYSLSLMLQDELMERGYRTTVFSDGLSAIRAMEDHQPDIIILDLKLSPEMSGWEVIERMRTSERLKGIPIIISSAFEERKKALQWGITHFLIKPYVPIKLIETIEAIMCKEKSIDYRKI
ncbi:PAS domain S-box-containing protein [Paenibacillus sp. DS2015]|uniref:ATP-binding protein n=1 Tax=Paenibacillus sp. DS2015 TaxID=3373917 RepID=UPI003D227950